MLYASLHRRLTDMPCGICTYTSIITITLPLLEIMKMLQSGKSSTGKKSGLLHPKSVTCQMPGVRCNNRFDIVCVSVCLSCSLSHRQMKRHTDLNFSMEVSWKDISVKVIGQRSRSTGQKNVPNEYSISMRCLPEL